MLRCGWALICVDAEKHGPRSRPVWRCRDMAASTRQLFLVDARVPRCSDNCIAAWNWGAEVPRIPSKVGVEVHDELSKNERV